MLPHERHQFYEFISARWGPDWAGRLMDMLPESDATQLASKDDVTLSVALLKTELVEVRTELKAEIADLRTELKTEMGELRTELKTEMGDLRTELKTEMGDLRTEHKTETADLRTEMHQGFAALDRRMAEQTRFLMLSMMTLWLTSLGAMIAVVKLG